MEYCRSLLAYKAKMNECKRDIKEYGQQEEILLEAGLCHASDHAFYDMLNAVDKLRSISRHSEKQFDYNFQ